MDKTMKTTQFLKFPGDGEMAVIPKDDYERLCEKADMLDDGIAYDEAKARLASGEDELVPGAVVDRLFAGDNPIRVWREHRGMTQGDLAAAVDVKQSYISALERGDRDGTISTLQAIARVLNVTLDDLVETEASPSGLAL